MIQVIDDARRDRLFRQTRGELRLYLGDSTERSSFIPPLPSVLAGPRMTVTIYQPLTGVGSGSWNDAYLNGLAAGLPPPRELPGWRADVRTGSALVELVRQEASREGWEATLAQPSPGSDYTRSCAAAIRRSDASCRADGYERVTAYRASSEMSRTGPGGSR